MRVMTYNILYGCHERSGSSFIYQPARAAAVREVVLAEAPDVLGVTEAVFCGPRGRHLLHDFSSMFDMPHVFFGGDEGDWTSCLVSRYPIVEATRIPLGGSPSGIEMSAIRAAIDVDGRRWRFDLVHPSPHITEAARVEAFRPLFAPTTEPRVIFGDFNALSDEDPYTHESLVADMQGRTADPAATATIMLDRQLLAATRAAGFRDTLPSAARTHTIPSHLPRPANQGARLRIDYVLVSDGIEAMNARVIQSDTADRASDHYPVVVDLRAG